MGELTRNQNRGRDNGAIWRLEKACDEEHHDGVAAGDSSQSPDSIGRAVNIESGYCPGRSNFLPSSSSHNSEHGDASPPTVISIIAHRPDSLFLIGYKPKG